MNHQIRSIYIDHALLQIAKTCAGARNGNYLRELKKFSPIAFIAASMGIGAVSLPLSYFIAFCLTTDVLLSSDTLAAGFLVGFCSLIGMLMIWLSIPLATHAAEELWGARGRPRTLIEESLIENKLARLCTRAVSAAIVVNERIKEWNDYLVLLDLGDADQVDAHWEIHGLITRAREEVERELRRAAAHLGNYARQHDDKNLKMLLLGLNQHHLHSLLSTEELVSDTLDELSDASCELVHHHRADLEIDPDMMLERALGDHRMAQLEEELTEARKQITHPNRVTN